MLFNLLAVLGLLSLTSSKISQQYHFINIRKNLNEAQTFCREKYTDLVTVKNEDEMKSLKNITDVSYDLYIGLYVNEGFSWHWCMPDTFYNAKTLQKWKMKQPCENNAGVHTGTTNCNLERQFVCFTAKNSTHIRIGKEKSEISDEQNCKTNSSENPIFIVLKNYTWAFIRRDVWIGLFKNDCLWVNGTGICNATQSIITLPFICYDDLKPTAKPDPLPTSTSGQNKTTSGTTTQQHRSTQNTIKGESTKSETTQIHPTSQKQDNMILVKDNLTWTEAVSYCRKHHVDLISIYSEGLQNMAASKVIQASSSYVWMGLRYTCSFKFWFWIKNREAGCYQNWASGHGPHGFEDCGLSGAMESTGGHQWVGRPESDRLNFICHTCAG